jgi:hypothetical protein
MFSKQISSYLLPFLLIVLVTTSTAAQTIAELQLIEGSEDNSSQVAKLRHLDVGDVYRSSVEIQQPHHLQQPLLRGVRNKNSSLHENVLLPADNVTHTSHTAHVPVPVSTSGESMKKDHLIAVAGHAVLKIDNIGRRRGLSDESAWNLLEYQKNRDFPAIVESHIKAGIDLAEADKQSVLIFSGGQTRKEAGPISEGASYYYYALTKRMLIGHSDITIALEEFARDSLENLLYSIARFKEVTGNYPKHITVVGFDFKEKRFVNVIRKALRFPMSSFRYVGVKPDTDRFNYDEAVMGERNVYLDLENDMYGCNTPALRDKRIERNPFLRTIPYSLSCPELSELFSWCRQSQYPGPLPW